MQQAVFFLDFNKLITFLCTEGRDGFFSSHIIGYYLKGLAFFHVLQCIDSHDRWCWAGKTLHIKHFINLSFFH